MENEIWKSQIVISNPDKMKPRNCDNKKTAKAPPMQRLHLDNIFIFVIIVRKLTEVINMAQTLVNFRMDEELKQNMEQTCQELGMNMTTAFTIFAKKMTREKRIPFEVSVDPFYSESNMNYLKKVISEIDSGKAKLREHELIED